MYRDFAFEPRRFHWESQSGTGPTHTKGKRHLEHESLGITPLLFVRETAKDDCTQTTPYTFLGPFRLESAAGERPMKIVWSLDYEMPAEVFRMASVAR